MEILVNRGRSKNMDYVAFELNVDDAELFDLGRDSLPADWQRSPWPMSAQSLGDQWLESKSSLGLIVPSPVISQERTILLNPLHPKLADITAAAVKIDYDLDPSLLNED
ncbi:MAG: RES domain-containing protein [Gammaproteobacteria bacterium]|jgi:RES domain-containing protein